MAPSAIAAEPIPTPKTKMLVPMSKDDPTKEQTPLQAISQGVCLPGIPLFSSYRWRNMVYYPILHSSLPLQQLYIFPFHIFSFFLYIRHHASIPAARLFLFPLIPWLHSSPSQFIPIFLLSPKLPNFHSPQTSHFFPYSEISQGMYDISGFLDFLISPFTHFLLYWIPSLF